MRAGATLLCALSYLMRLYLCVAIDVRIRQEEGSGTGAPSPGGGGTAGVGGGGGAGRGPAVVSSTDPSPRKAPPVFGHAVGSIGRLQI